LEPIQDIVRRSGNGNAGVGNTIHVGPVGCRDGRLGTHLFEGGVGISLSVYKAKSRGWNVAVGAFEKRS